MANTIERVGELGQSVWYDNMRRGMLESGELRRLIDAGITGLTSNPTIFEKAITGSTDYDDALLDQARQGKDADEIYEHLVVDDIRAAADLLRPIYDRTGGADGFASLEVSPHLAHDTDGTVAEAKRLFETLDRPNVMMKVPGTPQGIPAVHRLIGEGINVNVTLLFSLGVYGDVRQAYVAGVEDLDWAGQEPGTVASVASFFVSRVDTSVDSLLGDRMRDGADVEALLGRAAVANAKLAYRNFRKDFDGERFARLRAKGGRVQRPLWASTSTKNPAYSDVLYADTLIGPDTVNTMPDATVEAFLDHGTPAETLATDVDECDRFFDALEEAGVDVDEVTDGLLADGLQAFTDSFDSLIANIEEKRGKLLG